MTFSIVVPNQGQSPGLFPAQNNTNFRRLKEIINQEHNFLDTEPVPADSQGIHRRCTLINQATPSTTNGGSGVLYSKNDVNNEPQVNWFNNVSNYQITPGVQLFYGTAANVPPSTAVTIFADPGYFYYCPIIVCFTNSVGTSPVIGTALHFLPNQGFRNTTGIGFGQFIYQLANLQVFNNDPSNAHSIPWMIQVNRVQ